MLTERESAGRLFLCADWNAGSNLGDSMRLCIICKNTIEAERDDAMPDTRLCALHGKEIEKFGGEFRLGAVQEKTSKKTSFKVNYGGISTTRTRNLIALEKLQDEYEMAQFEKE